MSAEDSRRSLPPASMEAGAPSVRPFQTSSGARIFQIPLEEFPGFWGYVYLVLVEDETSGPLRVLIDTGSGIGQANNHLEAGLRAASAETGMSIGLADLTHIFITHGHIDHFGGLSYVRPRTPAQVGVHELDRRILTNYEERLAMAAHRLDEFLIEAGVGDERRSGLIDMYTFTKTLFRSVRVDFTYEAAGMQVGPFRMLHVPGHCAGHVVIRLDEVLFSGDHVLSEISPHQSPEHLTLSTGLDHYLHSLEKLRPWASEIRMTLGGHKEPIYDLEGRIDAIRRLHEQRLEKILQILVEPQTISDVSKALFGQISGYNVLLALEEAGAHVEYLYQRGLLGIENAKEFAESHKPIPVRYFRLTVP